MNSFLSLGFLTDEYNEGLLHKDDLRPYVKLGYLTQDQFNNMISKAPTDPIFNF